MRTPSTMSTGPIVVALGGNAIIRPGDDGTIQSQYRRAHEAMAPVADLIGTGAPVVLTHGNGPVVGSIVLRNELASSEVPPMPLFIAGADSAGGIGLMIQQTLASELARRRIRRGVATVVTQVVVDPEDPAFDRPTKPIGRLYSREEAARLHAERSWVMAVQPDGQYRRVVASPMPLEVVEAEAVRAVLNGGYVPIAAGGGGVPVIRDDFGAMTGVDAVVDKDWSSAVLAQQLSADLLVICMEAKCVYRDWGTPQQTPIRRVTLTEADALVDAENLAEGSILPKVAAATSFVRRSGRRALLCRAEDLVAAMASRAGTEIVPA